MQGLLRIHICQLITLSDSEYAGRRNWKEKLENLEWEDELVIDDLENNPKTVMFIQALQIQEQFFQ